MLPEVCFRLAAAEDAEELKRLNDAFNGPGANSLEGIREGLLRVDAETVFVAELEGRLAGFLCAQLLRSICYSVFYAEITEIYVEGPSRGRGVGLGLMRFAEDYYRGRGIHDFQLFTGAGNSTAQRFYERAGYRREADILYRKRDRWAEGRE